MGCCVLSIPMESSVVTEESSVNTEESFSNTEDTSILSENVSGGMEEEIIEVEEIAIAHMRKWLFVCNSRHTCNRPDEGATDDILLPRAPSHLIDTEDYCLVPGSRDKIYVALSYTWTAGVVNSIGKPSTNAHTPCRNLQLLQNNKEALHTPHVFLTRERLMSKVIQEAVKMTKLLGLRYLWVDQLCIIQDEESTAKHEEISNMDHIYACATVTLVAAATSGLFEEIFKGRVSSKDDTLEGPLATTQASVNLRELDQKAILDHYTSISKSMWAKRGWTYQEAILSKRVIFFYDDAVFWQCGCAVWDMDHLTPDEDNPIAATNMAKQTLTRRFLTPSNPDFGLYMDLICPFNGRNFTHEEDGLMACTGILNRLAPAFRGGFLGGLPIEFLDYALLWQPLKYCHRRTSSSSNKPCFPSWAWCGWQCLVDPWSFQSSFCLDGNDAVRKAKAGSWKLKNLINWQTKIISQEHSSIDSALPPSCAQEDVFSVGKSSISSPNIEIHDDFHSNTKAMHSSAGDRKSPGDQLILLECDTEIAAFIPAATLGIHESLTRHRAIKHVLWDPTMNEKPLHHLSKVVVLQDREGVFAGLVRVTENLDYKRLERTTRRFPEGITTKCGKGFEMNLIAISEGSATRGDMKMCFEEKVLRRSPYYDHAPFETEYDGDGWWTGSSATDWWGQGHVVLPAGNWNENLTLPKEDACDEEIVDFYNVLWVQKGDDQISRRLGCGRVLKDRWRQNQPRIVRVTLG